MPSGVCYSDDTLAERYRAHILSSAQPFWQRETVPRLDMAETDSVKIEEDGPLVLIGVNRPDAHNLWDLEVIQTVCRPASAWRIRTTSAWGVIFGHGGLFTAGLDLASVGPLVATGDINAVLPDDGYDPWNFFGEPCPKPIVVAVHGTCNTLGIELALASQVAVVAEGTRFAQLEVAHGIFRWEERRFGGPPGLAPQACDTS
jgi:enoyl-CoA hydratase